MAGMYFIMRYVAAFLRASRHFSILNSAILSFRVAKRREIFNPRREDFSVAKFCRNDKRPAQRAFLSCPQTFPGLKSQAMNAVQRLFTTSALLLIMTLAAWFRLHALGTNPPGVFRDEAEKAVNAWSLARTGQAFEFVADANGQPAVKWIKHPLFIHVYGVETSSIYHYALSMRAHGDAPPDARTMRLPAAFAGILSVLLVFIVLQPLYGSVPALLAALFLAVSPWSITFSRWAVQGAFIPPLMIMAVGGLLLAQRKHPAFLLLASIGLGIAFYTYSGARPFIAVFALAAALLHWRLMTGRSKYWAIGSVLLFVLLSAPSLASMLSPGGTTRLQRISVFSVSSSWQQSLALMLRSYLLHFTPSFLFLHGDPQPRHGVGSFGVLYPLEFLLALFGLASLFIRKTQGRWLLLAWIIFFPVGAMLTNPAEMPHALRTIVFLPLPQILAGYGLFSLYQWIARKSRTWAHISIILILLALGASATGYGMALFKKYPKNPDVGMSWEGGFGEALDYARQHSRNLPVVISGNIALPPYLILYYDKTPPEVLQSRGWAALGASLLPPGMPVRQIWPSLPAGSCLIALPPPYDELKGLAYPSYIAHPFAPTQAQREQLAPTYIVYWKK